MIYTCQGCGAWFDAKQLVNEAGERVKMVKCNYCGRTNEMSEIRVSHVARGYDYLAIGDFYQAEEVFSEAVTLAERGGNRQPHEMAYLGWALAKLMVQVIYEDEIADAKKPPVIICHEGCGEYLRDNTQFQAALNISNQIGDLGLRMIDRRRLDYYADMIDGIKREYRRLEQVGNTYQLFIAYEDESSDTDIGLNVVHKLLDNFPREFKQDRIYIPRKNFDNGDIEKRISYEAEILYAIDHSKCMVAVVDNDIDSRLIHMYSRYYLNKRSEKAAVNLCFVTFMGHQTIHLPDRQVANDVFSMEEPRKIHRFIANANKLILMDEITPVRSSTDEPPRTVHISGNKKNAPEFCGIRQVKFGSYPQRRELLLEIVNHFYAMDDPCDEEPGRWQPLIRNLHTGRTVIWYLDEHLGEKKYRALYFSRYRHVYRIRKSDMKPSQQRGAGYMPHNIYVFEFEPIVWNEMEMSLNSAVLVSAMGLDSRCFNEQQLCGDWRESTLRTWLNKDFLETAFTPEEREFLYERNGEYVFLIDDERDLGKDRLKSLIDTYNINGSDYFKCVGGSCDNNVSNMWVSSSRNFGDPDRAATIRPHSNGRVEGYYSDCTSVSVVPKIVVQLTSFSTD